jgi:hypothetical protein
MKEKIARLQAKLLEGFEKRKCVAGANKNRF